MINLQLFASLIVFALVGTGSPGGATVLITASGARFGFRKSLPLMLGIALGLVTLMAVSATGLGALIQSMPLLQLAMKSLGSAYFLWLAFQIGKSGAPAAKASGSDEPLRFPTGVLLLWLNPKAWAMALGAAAAYTELAPELYQVAIILGAVFGIAGFLSLTLWCLGGLLLSRALRNDWQWRAVNVTLALLLVASIIPMWL